MLLLHLAALFAMSILHSLYFLMEFIYVLLSVSDKLAQLFVVLFC